MAIMKPFLLVFFCLPLITACGGGGGSAARQVAPVPEKPLLGAKQKTMQPSDPQKPQQPQKNTKQQGTPSSEKAARAALAKLRGSGGILFELNNRQSERDSFCHLDNFGRPNCLSLGVSFTTLSEDEPSIATVDTNAAEAWKQGWTGKGVKVAIVDDYRASFQSVAHGVSTRGVVAQIAPEATFVWIQLDLPNNRDDLVLRAYTRAENEGAHIVNSSFSINPFKKGGIITRDRVRREVARELATASFQKVMLPAASASSFNANMLFIFSAGNHARDCINDLGIFPNFFRFKKNLSECSIEGRALLKLRETEKDAGDRAIFVGALTDNSMRLADYSLSAGALKNDFIVAHDDIYRANDGSGTSFAAPRVAGAAALVRHKFPSLNGPNLKQVMLRSADDLGEKGPDDVFGYGELNIMSALSPIDGLTK